MQTTVDRSLGLRERNKLEKRRRIYQAARQLFEKQGYDSTTLREIARAADVGEGTIFLYAKDKRELLFRIFKDELAAAFEEGFARVPHSAPFVEQIAAFTMPLLRLLQPHGALGRVMVRENFNLTGSSGEEFVALLANINDKFGRLLENAQQQGHIRKDRDLGSLIDAIWANFRFYADDWLRERRPVLADGVNRVRAGLTLLFEGIATEAGVRNSRAQAAEAPGPAKRSRLRTERG